ncbi:hypothetical protein EDD17DRAFT_1621811 [Pisolithus thermaeus]|nr:hypothetical protein EV401DRAFT_109835 [Pisolithus croceorrhizus]KAI6158525.1 hypothetical protein EDD17DRAFT_1621811 [Pisolithus thermaeus]
MTLGERTSGRFFFPWSLSTRTNLPVHRFDVLLPLLAYDTTKIFKSASSSRPDCRRPRFSTSPRLVQAVFHSRGSPPLFALSESASLGTGWVKHALPTARACPGGYPSEQSGEGSELPRASQECGPQSGLMRDIVVRSNLRLGEAGRSPLSLYRNARQTMNSTRDHIPPCNLMCTVYSTRF